MMRSLKYSLCLLVAFLFFSIATTKVNACSCFGDRPPCEAYWGASAVFIGVVTGNSEISVKVGDHQYPQRLVRFVIEEAFRGIQGPVAEIVTGMGGGDCGYGFTQGERYLVYAITNPQDKKLHTGICNRTRTFLEASEDIQYIRGLSSAAPGGLIYGEVRRSRIGADSEPQQVPMSGIKISIDGEEKQAEARTDLKGLFSVAGLPQGTYKLRISLPEGLISSDPEQEIRVSDRGCAKVHFGVVSDGRLSGRVISAAGQPMPKAEIALCDPNERRYRRAIDHAYSDADGRYEFKMIAPGKYVLGVRFDGLTNQNRPFPLIYYPGVESIDDATIVTIGDGERIENYDLLLPPLREERTVNGVVLWSDGKPASKARIEYSQVDVPIGYGAKPDQEGRFSFKVYDGMKITMRATVEVGNGKYVYSDYVEASLDGADVKVKITVPANR